MKGKLFIAALALLAVAACNKPEKNGPTPKDFTGDQYMAVNLSMSGSPTTKAWDTTSDNAYENATDAEIAVSSAHFLFFNGDTQCADPCDATLTGDEGLNCWSDPTAPHTGHTDQGQSSVIIVMKNPTAIPTSIVAILNYDESLSGKKLSDLPKEALAAKIADVSASGKFIMSNSVYSDNGEVVIGTPVTADNVCASADAAKENPVSIHVERVLAKVSLDDKASNNTENVGATDSQGAKIVVKIDGFWLDNTNPKAYLVKSLDPKFTGTWWNDAANFRSYWATSVPAAAADLGHGKITDATTADKYVNENTPAIADILSDADDSEIHAATQIVFATHLEVEGVQGTPDIVKYLSVYYTLDNWKVYIANTLGKYYKETQAPDATTTPPTPGVYTRISADDLTFTKATGADVDNPDWKEGDNESYGHRPKIEAWEAVYTVTCAEPVFNADGTPATFVPKKYKVQLFNAGKSYFYKPIMHNNECLDANKKPADGYYGIVRNHHYIVKATKIVGLGTPVPDPDQTIIPVKPVETESYIAAEIEVLKYKVVANDYVLE